MRRDRNLEASAARRQLPWPPPRLSQGHRAPGARGSLPTPPQLYGTLGTRLELAARSDRSDERNRQYRRPSQWCEPGFGLTSSGSLDLTRHLLVLIFNPCYGVYNVWAMRYRPSAFIPKRPC